MLQDISDKPIIISPEVKFNQTHDGVIIYNKSKKIHITGKNSYHLIAWLFRNFDGIKLAKEYLPEINIKTAKVLKIIKILINNEFIKVIKEFIDVDSKELIIRYHSIYNFLSNIYEKPLSILRSMQAKNFVCIGNGLALRNIISNLLLCGAHIEQVYGNKCDISNLKRLLAESNQKKQLNSSQTFLISIIDDNLLSNIKELSNETILIIAYDNLIKNVYDSEGMQQILKYKQVKGLLFTNQYYVYGCRLDDNKSLVKNIINMIMMQTDNYTNRPSPAAIAMAASFLITTFLIPRDGKKSINNYTLIKIDQYSLEYFLK